MAEQETARLCRLILQEHFGDIPARVGAELLRQGRLPLMRIVRATPFRSQRVANALLVLIQHNLVWHWVSPSGQEIFEINEGEILMRLRYGRYLAITEDVFDDSAVEIVSHILQHGRIRAGAIVPYLVPDDNDHKGRAKYASSLTTIIKEGYIKVTNTVLQTSPTDRLLQFEQEATLSARRAPAAKKGPLAAKEILEVKAIAQKRLEDETRAIEGAGLIKSVRDRTLTSKSSKRQKTTQEEEEEVIDENVYLRISPEKYNIHIRNEIFVASAAHRFNAHAGNVLNGALTAALPLEPPSDPLSSPRSEPISYHTIARSIPSSAPDLTSGLHIPKSILNSNNTDRHDRGAMRGVYLREYVNVLCAADNPSTAGRAGAFMAMTMAGGGGGGASGSSRKVTVEYDLIARRLRAQVLDNLVRDKWGAAGLRILNVLRDCGKLDGEQIAKRAMLKKADIQQFLKAMSTEGLISSFEMSRTADRTPSRSIYLWFIDTPRTYASLLYSLHRTLANILVRLGTEVESVHPELEKRSRTDVQGNEEQWMSRAERDRLEKYFEKRERLGVLLARVDESVFVLRDLARSGYAEDDPYVPNDPLMK